VTYDKTCDRLLDAVTYLLLCFLACYSVFNCRMMPCKYSHAT